jgi:hypothetical protein
MNEAAAAAWFMCIVRSFQAWIPRILAHTPENQQECLEQICANLVNEYIDVCLVQERSSMRFQRTLVAESRRCVASRVGRTTRCRGVDSERRGYGCCSRDGDPPDTALRLIIHVARSQFINA